MPCTIRPSGNFLPVVLWPWRYRQPWGKRHDASGTANGERGEMLVRAILLPVLLPRKWHSQWNQKHTRWIWCRHRGSLIWNKNMRKFSIYASPIVKENVYSRLDPSQGIEILPSLFFPQKKVSTQCEQTSKIHI